MRKNNINRAVRIITALIICVLAISTNMVAFAQTSGDFSVRAIIPDNQVDTRQTYFDLRMEPSAKQTIQVVIDNSRQEDLKVSLQLNPASTARNGLITYSEPEVRDESLKVAVTDVAALKEEMVTVPASGSYTVDIDIEMPKDELDGVILGGIVVSEEKTEDNVQMAEGVALANKITYVIGLKVTENEKTISPDFELVSAAPDLVNHKTAVVATLRNNAPIIVKNMAVEAKVYRSGSDTPLHQLSLDNTEMAPLSKGDFIIDWDDTELAAGSYRLVMSADYNGEQWNWDEEFIISSEADSINDEAVGVQRNYLWIYILVGVAVLVIAVLIAYLLGKRKRKR